MLAPLAATSRLEEMKVKVVLVGAPRVGKTSLIRRFVLNQFDDRYRTTLGAVVSKRVAEVPVGGQTVRVTMTVWDGEGQYGGPDPVRDVDLYGAQGALAVCDVTDAATVPPLRLRLGAAFQAAGEIPVQILMNKADLGLREDVRAAGLQAGLSRGVPCYLTSAKAGDNVIAAFEDLARRIVERTLMPDSAAMDETDQSILFGCEEAPRTPLELALRERLPLIFAEGRLERLRRRGFLSLASVELDGTGRPILRYGRTPKPLQVAVVACA